MGPASGPAFGRAELAVWGGWGARVCFGRGVPSRGGALPATRPMLYGLPYRLSLWHRRRSSFACPHVLCGWVHSREADARHRCVTFAFAD